MSSSVLYKCGATRRQPARDETWMPRRADASKAAKNQSPRRIKSNEASHWRGSKSTSGFCRHKRFVWWFGTGTLNPCTKQSDLAWTCHIKCVIHIFVARCHVPSSIPQRHQPKRPKTPATRETDMYRTLYIVLHVIYLQPRGCLFLSVVQHTVI